MELRVGFLQEYVHHGTKTHCNRLRGIKTLYTAQVMLGLKGFHRKNKIHDSYNYWPKTNLEMFWRAQEKDTALSIFTYNFIHFIGEHGTVLSKDTIPIGIEPIVTVTVNFVVAPAYIIFIFFVRYFVKRIFVDT
eukprot:9531967-Ditylum_brightwellii.AAC.1